MSKLKFLEDQLKTKIVFSKEHYLTSLADAFRLQPLKLYQYLKQLVKRPVRNSFVGTNNEILQHPQAISNAFNKFFNSTFTDSNFKLLSILPTPSSQLCTITITAGETYEALSALDFTKAMGCDNVSPKILKAYATSLCEPIALLFNKSLILEKLPMIWKYHKIIPIPKSGD